MTALIIGLLLCLALSVVVMGLVAVPARREGRDLLTPRGERVVVKVRSGADVASSKTGAVVGAVTPSRNRTS